MDLLFFHGLVLYPRLEKYAPGGRYLLEVVVTQEATTQLSLQKVNGLAAIEQFPITIKSSLDGGLTLRGFPRDMFSADRAEYEAIELAKMLQERLGLTLDTAQTSRLRCYDLN